MYLSAQVFVHVFRLLLWELALWFEVCGNNFGRPLGHLTIYVYFAGTCLRAFTYAGGISTHGLRFLEISLIALFGVWQWMFFCRSSKKLPRTMLSHQTKSSLLWRYLALVILLLPQPRLSHHLSSRTSGWCSAQARVWFGNCFFNGNFSWPVYTHLFLPPPWSFQLPTSASRIPCGFPSSVGFPVSNGIIHLVMTAQSQFLNISRQICFYHWLNKHEGIYAPQSNVLASRTSYQVLHFAHP